MKDVENSMLPLVIVQSIAISSLFVQFYICGSDSAINEKRTAIFICSLHEIETLCGYDEDTFLLGHNDITDMTLSFY